MTEHSSGTRTAMVTIGVPKALRAALGGVADIDRTVGKIGSFVVTRVDPAATP